MDFIKSFNAAKAVSTPLIAIRTPDPQSTMSKIASEGLRKDELDKTPLIMWDCLQGLRGINKPGQKEVARVLDGADPAMASARPYEMLMKAAIIGSNAIIFMLNAHLYWKTDDVTGAPTVTGIWNLRDNFKAKSSVLVMLITAGAYLPIELASDVLVLDEPLLTKEQIGDLVTSLYTEAKSQVKGMPDLKDKDVQKATDALIGLPAFPAEQTLSMNITAKGILYDSLWESKRKVIEQTRGLSVWRSGPAFKDIGGCENAKNFFTNLLKGKEAPSVLVFMDEIEKMFAGVGTDLSGTKTELLGTFLTWMEDRKAMGSLFIGPPGSGKTMLGRAIANEANILGIGLDVAAMQSSLVGSSGENFRTGLKVVDAASGGNNILVVGTCNSIGSLPPEVRRRFTLGTFFFDLATTEEQDMMWKLYKEKFGIAKTDLFPIIDGQRKDKGWTGAEIRNCCQQAYRLGITLKEAKEYIIPVAESAKDQIEGLRKAADGKFISAGKPGTYKYQDVETSMPEPAKITRMFKVDPSAVGSA